MAPISCEECRAQLAALPLNARDLSRAAVAPNAVAPNAVAPNSEKSASENLSPELENHLQNCVACRIEYSKLRAVIAEMRALPHFAAPPELRGRIRAQIATERDAKAARSFDTRFKNVSARFKIPRWAVYSLPAFVGAACLLLIVAKEPRGVYTPNAASSSRQNAGADAMNAAPQNIAPHDGIAPKSTAPLSSQNAKPKTRANTSTNAVSTKTPTSSTRNANTSPAYSQPDFAPSQPSNAKPKVESSNPAHYSSPAANASPGANASAKQNGASDFSTKSGTNSNAKNSVSPLSQNANSASNNSANARAATSNPAPVLSDSGGASGGTISSEAAPKRQLFARLEILPSKTDSARAKLSDASAPNNSAPKTPATSPMEERAMAGSSAPNSSATATQSSPAKLTTRSGNEYSMRASNGATLSKNAASAKTAAPDTELSRDSTADNVAGDVVAGGRAANAAARNRSQMAAPNSPQQSASSSQSGAPALPSSAAPVTGSPADVPQSDTLRSDASRRDALANAESSGAAASRKTSLQNQSFSAPAELKQTKQNQKSQNYAARNETQRARLTFVSPADIEKARLVVIDEGTQSSSQIVWSGSARCGETIAFALNLPRGNKNQRFQVVLQRAISRGVWRSVATETLRPTPAKS